MNDDKLASTRATGIGGFAYSITARRGAALLGGRAATQAKAFELFAAVGAVDVEAIDALPHRSAITPRSAAGVRFFY
jgi:hypothetical protein